MILIAIGSSLSFAGREPAEIVRGAIGALGRLGRVAARSRLYASPAFPDPSDPPFVNAVVSLETDLAPAALLAALHAVEAGFGRRRCGRTNAPRTLDLDLIDYNGLIRKPDVQCALELPHPRMAGRDFVLAPLAEVAPQWAHPLNGKSPGELLEPCETSGARPLEAGEGLLRRS